MVVGSRRLGQLLAGRLGRLLAGNAISDNAANKEQATEGGGDRHHAMPHAFGDRFRDVTAESCAVAAPEREPRPIIIAWRRADAQVGGHG